MRVPHLEHGHVRELSHRGAVGADRPTHNPGPFFLCEAVLAPGDLKTGRQPFHVPFPRARRRLVEVVHVEEEVTFGGAEDAEVGEMCVTAELDPGPGVGRGREIRGRRKRRAAEVGEGRHQHAPVTDGDQLGHPDPCLFLQQRDRVAPVCRGLPNSMMRARGLDARGLPVSRSRLRRIALRAREASPSALASAVAWRFGPSRRRSLGRGCGAFVPRVHDDLLRLPMGKRAQRGGSERPHSTLRIDGRPAIIPTG
jgi:hypothetical protein